MSKGLLILFVYAAVMLITTVVMTKREKNVERFCVGNRNSNWIVSALSIAATWIWAPALFVSVEKAYTNGIVGLFWFLVPNVLCLIFFIPFAKKIRNEMPEGITLSGYMKDKYKSEGVKRVYLFQLASLSVLSTGVQLLAGGKALSMLTGLPFPILTVALAIIAYSCSQFSGIKASLATNTVQMLFMLIVSISFVFFGVRGTGTADLVKGLSGISGEFGSLFSERGLEIFLAFGLPTTVGLMSGPFGDQCFWQRAFTVRKDRIGRAFFVGALLFGIVPLSMGIVGFIGAGSGYAVQDIGVLNFELISNMFPAWVGIPFLFMVLSGLLSTVDSNLCSISSLSTDIIKKSSIGKTKIVMILLMLLGIAVANIPGLTVTHLFLLYGTLRASTMLPTIMTLKGINLTSKGVTMGIITALVVGLPIFAYGNIYSIAVYKTIGSLITVLSSGLVAILISRLEVLHESNSR